jgi:hypothetical protein
MLDDRKEEVEVSVNIAGWHPLKMCPEGLDLLYRASDCRTDDPATVAICLN